MSVERDLADVSLPPHFTAAPPPPHWLLPPELILLSVSFLALSAGLITVVKAPPEEFAMAKMNRLAGRHLLTIGAFIPVGAVLGMFSVDTWALIRLKSNFWELTGLYAVLYVCACLIDWGLQLLKRDHENIKHF